ncbi:GFA family protein [Neisseriaceae bacterium PsAf]|nr:GFA family protein [Neisseriaceae bacterium PsAf]
MENLTKQGTCLCGKVKFAAKLKNQQVAACHCSICRKINAGPIFAVTIQPDLKILQGEEYVSCYESSQWAYRQFCSYCGTYLYTRMQAENQEMYLNAELLELKEGESLEFLTEIFYDDKPNYYEFSNHTLKLAGYSKNKFEDQ